MRPIRLGSGKIIINVKRKYLLVLFLLSLDGKSFIAYKYYYGDSGDLHIFRDHRSPVENCLSDFDETCVYVCGQGPKNRQQTVLSAMQ